MPAMRWRASLFLTLLAAFALSTNLPTDSRVSAKDKTDGKEAGDSASDAAGDQNGKPTKTKAAKKPRPDASKKKKGARGGDDAPEGATGSGSSSGGGVSATAPGAAGTGSNSGQAGAAVGNQTPPGSVAGPRRTAPATRTAGGGQTGVAAAVADPAAQPGPDPALVKKVMDIQNRASVKLLKQKGIVGTSTGLDDDGNVVIRVYTTGADEPQIPKTLENIPVVEVLTGPLRPYWQSATFDPKARQQRPVPIGVSAFTENGACTPIIAAGTLGCRLKGKDGGVFALSNNHVFAAENAGVIGDKIIQPGSLDEFNDGLNICDSSDVVGTLFKFKLLVPGGAENVIDAAVMKTTKDEVGNSTPQPPIAYGTPRTTVFERPYLGLKVQKLGRTTGFTKGTITGLNVMAIVPYNPGLVFFVQQIEITGDNGLFSNSGDSGSLIVSMDRFPVALLFAGGGGTTIGNPIQAVLDEFGMTIDGDDSPVVPPGKEARSEPEGP